MLPVVTSCLDANLAALGERNEAAVAAIRAAAPREDLELADTDEGVPTATLDGVRLASGRRPLEEGRRLAETVDLAENAVVVVVGFGLGYHVRALAERAGRTTVLLVYEPDLGLLRAALERIDHAAWLRDSMVVLVTDGHDRTGLGRTLAGAEGILAQGVTILAHAPSRRRLAESSGPFCRIVTDLVETARTTLVTTLVRSADTVENLLQNVAWYAAGAGIGDLRDAAAGHLAVVVSAGPSLHRNIAELAAPGVRDRCIIVAVQTTLKPLLAAGVRPHFVTALDYHEISTRFYEGLDADAVRDTTLVIDAKAHPSIAEAYPGRVRCCANDYLDRVLGPLARDMGQLPAGATVAHLALYLARHLGGNPIALIGQDLGFSDGLYYAPGTAIHDVWAPELNPFNTIAMMEWQRIARHRLHLHELEDIHGRPIYSDVQMVTYLRQFERDFAECAAAGIRILDATEGGVRKDGAEPARLRDVLAEHASRPLPELPSAPAELDPERVRTVERRLAEVQREVDDMAATAERTRRLLEKMLRDQDDPERMKRHFDRLERERRRVEERFATFALLNEMNQLGAFKRMKADRRLQLAQQLDAAARQRAQLERDLVNVEWLRDTGHELHRLLEAGRSRLTSEEPHRGGRPAERTLAIEAPARTVRVGAIVPVDAQRGGLGNRRDLGATGVLPGAAPSLLHATLARLGAARGLDEIVVLAPEDLDVEALIDRAALPRPVVVERTPGTPFGPEHEAIAVARRWAATSWRGGIAGMSAWDEALCPASMAAVAVRRRLDAVVPCGPDWPFIDISERSGVDAAIARHRSHPDEHRIVFTQAPPGLAPCVVSTAMLSEFTVRTRLATVGGLLVYQPHAPQGDPIARDANVQIPAPLRHAMVRGVADTERSRAHCRAVLAALGPDAGAEAVAARLAELDRDDPRPLPQHFIVELTPRRQATGVLARHPYGAIDRPPMSMDVLEAILAAAAGADDAVLTFGGLGDPLEHPDLEAMLERARSAGVPVHVRTELATSADRIEMLGALADVVSVEVHADRAATYATMLGRDDFRGVLDRIQHLIDHRRHRSGSAGSSGISLPWIMPRLERRSETYADINSFYDRWQHALGTAVIETPPPFPDGPGCPRDELTDASDPPAVRRRQGRLRMLVQSDGGVPVSEIDLPGADVVGRVGGSIGRPGQGGPGIADLWTALLERRGAEDLYRIHRP